MPAVNDFLKRALAAALVFAFAFGLAGFPARAQADGDSLYQAIEKAYFSENFRRHPIAATGAGVHEYDRLLDRVSARDFRAELQSDRSFLRQLDALVPSSLSPEVQLDRQLLINQLQDDLLLNGTMAVWRHNPDIYVGMASGAVFSIVSRAYAPLGTRLGYVVARERQIPRLFAEAKANLGTVDAATARVAYQDAVGSLDFFRMTVPLAFAPVRDARARRTLKAANLVALHAAADFANWIKRGPLAHPAGTFAIGTRAYADRLRYEEAITMPLEQYLSVGESALAQTKAQFVSISHEVAPGKSPSAVLQSIYKEHPAANVLLATAEHDLVALRHFIEVRHLLTLPPDADIRVIETPPFERSTVFAAMDAPGPLERVATRAYYYVTPVDPKWDAKHKDDFLGVFNNFTRPIISAHEVYPGHFTNFTIDRHLPLSLTRKLLGSASFAEGWAHYDEQLVVDEGWGNGDPRVRLAQLDEALLRECRYVVGLKLHTRGMTLEQATKFFEDNAFLSRAVAYPEALRGTQDATYGYYTLGKLEILKLRADMKRKLGPVFTLQKFHDALLAHGDPPIPLLRPLLLGTDDDGKPL